jgi:hypothetical protein
MGQGAVITKAQNEKDREEEARRRGRDASHKDFA